MILYTHGFASEQVDSVEFFGRVDPINRHHLSGTKNTIFDDYHI